MKKGRFSTKHAGGLVCCGQWEKSPDNDGRLMRNCAAVFTFHKNSYCAYGGNVDRKNRGFGG